MRPVLVRVTTPRAIPAEQNARITLAIEEDRSGRAVLALNELPDQLTPIRTESVEDGSTRVYQTQISRSPVDDTSSASAAAAGSCAASCMCPGNSAGQ